MTANPAFKVTLYLQVEHLTDGTRRLNSTLHCRSPGARPKWAKKWDRCWEFFATGDRRRKWTLTPLLLIETALQTHILSEETYGYNAEGLKSSASHAFREITLLKNEKLPNLSDLAAKDYLIGKSHARLARLVHGALVDVLWPYGKQFTRFWRALIYFIVLVIDRLLCVLIS